MTSPARNDPVREHWLPLMTAPPRAPHTRLGRCGGPSDSRDGRLPDDVMAELTRASAMSCGHWPAHRRHGGPSVSSWPASSLRGAGTRLAHAIAARPPASQDSVVARSGRHLRLPHAGDWQTACPKSHLPPDERQADTLAILADFERAPSGVRRKAIVIYRVGPAATSTRSRRSAADLCGRLAPGQFGRIEAAVHAADPRTHHRRAWAAPPALRYAYADSLSKVAVARKRATGFSLRWRRFTPTAHHALTRVAGPRRDRARRKRLGRGRPGTLVGAGPRRG